MELTAHINPAPGRCWHCLSGLVIIGILSLMPTFVYGTDIYIVQSRASGAHAAVARLVKQELGSSLPPETSITVVMPSELAGSNRSTGANDFIVTVGTDAFASVLAGHPVANVVATLITEQSFAALKIKYNRSDRKTSALFIEQNFQRNLDLARIVLPQKKVGVLLGSGSSKLYDSLVKARQKQGIDLYIKKMKPGGNLISALDQVLKNSGVLIAFADPEVSNRNTAQHILLTTYRQRIPVVAYSRAYVKAGALMAAYSTPEQYARQTVEMILQGIRHPGDGLVASQYPKYFSVEVNRSVAHSLGIDIKPVDVIESQLRALAAKHNE